MLLCHPWLHHRHQRPHLPLPLAPVPTSFTPKPKKRKTTENQPLHHIEKQIHETQELIKTMSQPADADSDFGKMIANMMRGIPEGWCKDNLRIEIQQKIMQAKHQPSNQSHLPHQQSNIEQFSNFASDEKYTPSFMNLGLPTKSHELCRIIA